MPNIANQPFADALAKAYPAPDGIKIFNASETAEKMLSFWSVKQSTLSCVVRVGNSLIRLSLHKCPHCDKHLSAQATKMSQKEREMIASLMSMLKPAEPAKPASKPAKKQASQPVPAQATPVQPEEELTLEQLDQLTAPGGGA